MNHVNLYIQRNMSIKTICGTRSSGHIIPGGLYIGHIYVEL